MRVGAVVGCKPVGAQLILCVATHVCARADGPYVMLGRSRARGPAWHI